MTDGGLFRGELNSKKYANLIEIPIPLAIRRLMVFTKDADLQVNRD